MQNRRLLLTFTTWKMSTRIAVIVSVIVFLSGMVGSSLMINRITNEYQLELGKRVMAIGQSLAQSPTIQEGLQNPDGSATIQPVAERVRLATDVEYVVVINMDKIRLSHPMEDRIGSRFEGGDEGPALAEESYVSRARGVKGFSVRAFVPVMNQEGTKQVGVAVVGVLVPTFLHMVWQYRADLYLSVLLGILFAILGAIWVANRIKRQMFNMEPLDIAHLLEEREAVIESIADGIIVIDRNERITVFNKQAQRMMGIKENVVGRPIHDVIIDSHLPEVLRGEQPQFHQQRQVNNTVILSNRVPIKVKGKILGAMSTLQDRSEVYQLAEKLTGVQNFIGALRAQNHEYLNKLHTIAGLIQLQRYEEVVDRIIHFNEEKQSETHFLTQRIKNYSISGLIVGKMSHAREQGVELQVNPQTSLPVLPVNITEADLLMVLGNLLENAIYAAAKSARLDKKVTLLVEGNEDGIEIHVEDYGIGMAAHVQKRIFEYGFTTKGEKGQGIGLHLVKQYVDLHGGDMHVESQVDEGTRFVVILPGPDWN